MTDNKERGTVEVPQKYFLEMAKHDYDSWENALPREFYQNSVDAGATLIQVAVDKETRGITVTDNGCGMDYNTIKKKLLVFGGSKKRKGSVGAFGKAKEILFFSWESYCIRTQDMLVCGKGNDYTIERVEDWQEGTVCFICIWDDEDFDNIVTSFEYVAGLFEVDCQIEVNCSVVNKTLTRGDLIKSMDWASLYLDDSSKSWYVNVRIDGQWMFSEFLSGAREIGQFILEVHGDSTQALTSNRDSLKQDYSRKFRQLMEQLITDTKSMTNPEPVIVRERFTGLGRVVVSKEKAAKRIAEALDEIDKRLPNAIFNEQSKEVQEEIADGIIDSLPMENATSVDIDRVVETASRGDHWTYEDRFSFIGFQPDFHVIYEEGSKAGKKLEKYMQWPSVLKLANAWTEILKQILLDIEIYNEFHVGFNFSLKTTASYEKIDGVPYFYLNPDLLLSDCEGKLKWPNQRKLLREDLILKGIHEITHLFVEMHNEDFVLKSEWIRARTWKSLNVYPKIMTECFRST